MFKPENNKSPLPRTSKLLTVEEGEKAIEMQGNARSSRGIERKLGVEEIKHKIFLYGKALGLMTEQQEGNLVFDGRDAKKLAFRKVDEINGVFGTNVASLPDTPRMGVATRREEYPVSLDVLAMKETYKDILDEENTIRPEYRSIAA